MINLVRGAFVLAIISMFVVFIYAQTQPETRPETAKDSQQNIENNNKEANISSSDIKVESPSVKEITDTKTEGSEEAGSEDNDSNKKVKKTGSSRMTKGVFTATAYCLRGRTASGAFVRNGIVAADPRVLRLGTRINLGGARSGQYLVADTGGAIKGRRLDIWMASCADARRFGRRNVTVELAGK
ncbi:MAG: 3D domain-containing protein [Pyrinomonadaceae bacterium]